jgi:hypothetical protein
VGAAWRSSLHAHTRACMRGRKGNVACAHARARARAHHLARATLHAASAHAACSCERVRGACSVARACEWGARHHVHTHTHLTHARTHPAHRTHADGPSRAPPQLCARPGCIVRVASPRSSVRSLAHTGGGLLLASRRIGWSVASGGWVCGCVGGQGSIWVLTRPRTSGNSCRRSRVAQPGGAACRRGCGWGRWVSRRPAAGDAGEAGGLLAPHEVARGGGGGGGAAAAWCVRRTRCVVVLCNLHRVHTSYNPYDPYAIRSIRFIRHTPYDIRSSQGDFPTV